MQLLASTLAEEKAERCMVTLTGNLLQGRGSPGANIIQRYNRGTSFVGTTVLYCMHSDLCRNVEALLPGYIGCQGRSKEGLYAAS